MENTSDSFMPRPLLFCLKSGRSVCYSVPDNNILQSGGELDKKYHDHELKGKYKNFRECHIQPDWLLIYLIENDILTLTLIDTGTHADLFNM